MLTANDFYPPLPFIEPGEPFEDRNGLPFAQAKLHLPQRASEWPGRESSKDPNLSRLLHAEMWRCSNPWCRNPAWLERAPWCILELHHMIGGRGGRSDERTNILPLCRWCHQGPHQITDNLGFVLFLKWLQAGEEIDWLRLAVLHGRFLPDLLSYDGEVLCEN